MAYNISMAGIVSIVIENFFLFGLQIDLSVLHTLIFALILFINNARSLCPQLVWWRMAVVVLLKILVSCLVFTLFILMVSWLQPGLVEL